MIDVSYELYTNGFKIRKKLETMTEIPLMSLDFEVQSIYSLEERTEAKELVKKHLTDLSNDDMRLSKLVANSSGLSHPKITKITHVIFGLSKSQSIIFIINDKKTEQLVMNWLVEYQGKLIFWNAGFDVKIIHDRTNKFPKDFDDGQLLARCFINHTQDWFCKTGLKHLMSQYYNPKWTEIESYDIVDYKNEAFLRYSAIDGAATYYGWELLQDMKKDFDD